MAENLAQEIVDRVMRGYERGHRARMANYEKLYQERLDERRRQQRLSEADEIRMRTKRSQLAALLPMGQTVRQGMTELELDQEIAARGREREKVWKKEDADAEYARKLAETNGLADAALDREAEALGVDIRLPRAQKVVEVAKAKADRAQEIATYSRNASLDAARKSPGYENLLNSAVGMERNMELALAPLLVPQMSNTGLTPDDIALVNRLTAEDPRVVAAFMQADPKGYKARLQAMTSGNIEGAWKGIDPNLVSNVAMEIADARSSVLEAVAKSGAAKDRAAVSEYLNRQDAVPRIIQEYRQRVERLYSLPGVGEALRIDAAQAASQAPSPSAMQQFPNMPGQATQSGLDSAADPAAQVVAAGLPEPAAPGTAPQSKDPYEVQGIFPQLFGPQTRAMVSDAVRGAVETPALREGGGMVASGGLGALQETVGRPVNNTLATLFGGRLQDIDTARMVTAPAEAAMGALGLSTAPIGMVGGALKRGVFDYLPRRYETDEGWRWLTIPEQQAYENMKQAQAAQLQANNPMLRAAAMMPPLVR